jgi:cytochrome c peroxidase
MLRVWVPLLTAALAAILAPQVGCSDNPIAPGDAGSADVSNDSKADGGAQTKCADNALGNYAAGPYGFDIGAVLPDLSFSGYAVGANLDAAPATVAMHDWRKPCVTSPAILVLRVGADFCGPCRYAMEHAADFEDARAAYLDILVANNENRAPEAAALRSALRRLGTGHSIAADPAHRLAQLAVEQPALPLYVLVDQRSMRVLRVLSDPPAETAREAVDIALAELEGRALAPRVQPATIDGFYTHHLALLREMRLPGAPPADLSNAVAESANARDLGQKLFADTRLAHAVEPVSCATCHDSTKGFADARPTAEGAAKGQRNTPSILFAAFDKLQFWDGRADTQWSQALGPAENPSEMNSTRLEWVHILRDHYDVAYRAAFPTESLAVLDDLVRFPRIGKPGDAAYDAMSAADKRMVSRQFANAGKAIAAFERSLRAQPNRLDAYLNGDTTALTAQEKLGAQNFFISGCAQCHYGPTLSDGAFHNLRFPTGQKDGTADRGRAAGAGLLIAAEFGASTDYSDARTIAPLALSPGELLGAFKTPHLRGVANTAPYGHGGTYATLDEVVRHYGMRGLPAADTRAIGTTEPWAPLFDDLEQSRAALVAFLKVLEAKPVVQ